LNSAPVASLGLRAQLLEELAGAAIGNAKL
jgi:hypothetical protein